MYNLEIGQALEFIEPASADGRVIPKGTRVRVGHIMAEFGGPNLTLVILEQGIPETLIVDRHVVTPYCRLVANAWFRRSLSNAKFSRLCCRSIQ